jgi:nitroreductase
VTPGDHRAQTGTQAYVATAPVNLVYVADFAKTGNAPAEEREIFTPADAGFIAENAYLFCTSEGLAVVVRGLIDRPALGKVLNLRADQKIILAQTIGLPKK